MSYGKALAISAAAAITGAFCLLVWGLVAGGDLRIPYLLDLSSRSSSADDTWATTLSLNPLGVLLAIALTSATLWAALRLVRIRQAPTTR